MKLQTVTGFPDKSNDLKVEVRTMAGEVPDDDLDVTLSKRPILVSALHPRCRIDRGDAESRAEVLRVDA